MRIVDRVRDFARRHRLFGSATRVVVAVSGGSDSVALAHIMAGLGTAGEACLAGVAHFNHQLRETATRDEEFSAALAASLGVPIEIDRADVAGRARRERRSIEGAARTCRYEFFERARRRFDADAVALGHTRDDQAETVLLRLLRGAGPRGLAAIHPRHGVVIRPLLDCRRHDLRAYLSERGVGYVEDETNADVDIPRNRIRAELLPLLVDRFNPAIVDVLADEAELAREIWEWMEEAGTELLSSSRQSAVGSRQSPVPSSQSPVASSQSPVASPQSPVASPQSLVASPQSPVASPQSPVASPQSPVPSRQSSVASRQSPVPSRQSADPGLGTGDWRLGTTVFDIPALLKAPAPLRRMVLWQAMSEVGRGRPVSFQHVEAALRLMEAERDGAVDLPGQRVHRDGSMLVLTGRPPGTVGRSLRNSGPANPGNLANLFEYALSIPGEVTLSEANCVVSVEPAGEAGVQMRATVATGETTALVRRDLCPGPLVVRNRRPGDRFKPVGLGGGKKLQDLFVDRKVARECRDQVPIVVDPTGRIVWVAGHGIDEAFRVTDSSQPVLIFRLRQLGGPR